ncbi:DNA-binding transcriptional LysR family regulator [Homoserinimonas aerilata]|uniref:DNA-binding transcriptional LysR family regulator n=1 Tax=Homoserinimonas aerilata TaxID=1162970 RepID=A0A542YJX3_9MICO|nr:LysR family transcriptional regulator [Homoserinimonas aerilata]TQL48406.1 DNA-binding transcriptional LysR family regulator [Homoserinimonas aerilata]
MNLAGKDLNLLVALRALLEETNVTRAGDRLQVGQSAMSSALARLRQQYNDELLVRVGRDYELTPLARLLLPQVQRTIPLIERALGSEGPFDPLTSYRSYTIRGSDFAMTELQPMVTRALDAAPGIRIDMLPLPAQPTSSERDLLKSDFVAAVPGIGIEGNSRTLFRDVYVCLVDSNNPALIDGQLSWDAFRGLPQAVANFGQAHHTPADRRLRELGFPRVARVTTNSFLPLPSAIAGTDLVAVVPRRLAERLGPTTGTIGVPTPFGEVEIIETLWWHPAHDSDPAHVWLRETLLEGVPA